MQVKLKVIGGRNDGREISISVPEFIIGRGENAQLKPSSDLVSRNHCQLKIENGKLLISDMGSRNGTYVNGSLLEAAHEAKVGDTLRVGRLQFEVLIDHVQPGNKKPRVAGVADAANRVSANTQERFDEDSITDWLSLTDDENEKNRAAETIRVNLDQDSTKMFTRSDEVDETESGVDTTEEEAGGAPNKRHKKYKKLPTKDVAKAESSKSAADDVLRKFFNRR